MNVPKLRFKEFDGEWEENKLSNLLVKIEEKATDATKGVVLTSSRTGLFPRSEYFNGREEKDIEGYSIIPKNTFTYRQMSDDNTFHINYNTKYNLGLVSPEYPVFKTNNFLTDEYFLNYINNSPRFKKHCVLQKKGGTRTRLYFKVLGELVIAKPSIEEQKKIGDFFNLLNKKIQLQQQKIDLLQEQKKGYMQKVFKQELRFKNEEGQYYPDWKNRKIRDLFEVTRGHVLSTKEISEMGKYPVYSSQTKNNGLLGYYDEFLFENAITWTTDGANAGNVKYRSGKFYCTNVCGVLLNKEGYANKCIAEIINSIAFRYVSYVGNPKLMNNVMGDISIDFPCIEEQKKISDFLLILDNKINLEETTLKLLRNQKKGFMQQMFI